MNKNAKDSKNTRIPLPTFLYGDGGVWSDLPSAKRICQLLSNYFNTGWVRMSDENDNVRDWKVETMRDDDTDKISTSKTWLELDDEKDMIFLQLKYGK